MKRFSKLFKINIRKYLLLYRSTVFSDIVLSLVLTLSSGEESVIFELT